LAKNHSSGKTVYSMINNQHPSEFIPSELADIIRDTAGESEQLKQLHPSQLKLIREQKWFQLFVPKIYGGLELSLPEALRMEEALAWADGSLGWTVTLCAGAGWFIGFLDQEIVSAVFKSNSVCLAGSGKPSGIAKVLSDGYDITGHWDYATGALHATAFTANCLIASDGVILKNEDGTPLVQSFLFLREEVTVHENWSSMGMIATGSHSFEVKAARVKNNRVFQIDGQNARLPNPIFQYPFIQFAETTLAVNSSGMVHRFLELCEDPLHMQVEECRKILDRVRETFYEAVENSWSACLNNQPITLAMLNQITRVSMEMTRVSRQVVNDLYPFCGMKAADPRNEINRVWRNLHTASLHRLLSGNMKIL
jgi:hypothetical protein